MNGVIIICTKVTNQNNANLLIESSNAARKNHPELKLVILNDNSSEKFWPTENLPEDAIIETIEDPYIGCGEINAYIWASKHSSEYDVFIFIHDSVLIKQPLPLTFPENINFMPLWNTNGRCVKNETHGKEVDEFVSKFTPNMKDEVKLVKEGKGDVIFGCMGIWNKTFAEYLNTTNLSEVAQILNRRILRCFFERFSYCLVKSQQSVNDLQSYTIGKNIFSHPNSFKNSSFTSNSGNPYLVKVWQGR